MAKDIDLVTLTTKKKNQKMMGCMVFHLNTVNMGLVIEKMILLLETISFQKLLF